MCVPNLLKWFVTWRFFTEFFEDDHTDDNAVDGVAKKKGGKNDKVKFAVCFAGEAVLRGVHMCSTNALFRSACQHLHGHVAVAVVV